MYRVNVRDHVMIAHSLRGEVFGPAQRLHGATYVIDATFAGERLDDDGSVVDIGRATEELRSVLADRAHSGALGAAARDLAGITVTLHESHVAWASYERSL